MAARLGNFAAVALLLAAASAHAESAPNHAIALPRPGLKVEWRQAAAGVRPTIVRQEITAVNGTTVAYRETAVGGSGAPVQYETWRGLVLLKRHVPQSDAFTESTLSFSLDIPALEALVPPAAGRHARLAVKGRSASRLGVRPTSPFLTSDIVGTLMVAVERRERITVPAGTFATVVLRHETALEQVGMNNRTTVAARTWFVSALGWPVKKQTLDARGAPESEAVAIAIRLR
jgi:hypothetical protein